MKKFLVFIMLLALCVPCSADDSTLAVCENGKFNGFISSDVITWLGIPYAKAPVNALRWKAPQAPDASSKTFEANRFSAMPIQKVSAANAVSQMPQDEDCLYLNVWKASDDTVVAPRPVMVWIHGGSFRANGTAEPEWLGNQLAADQHEVIVVSVGYRLGLMGFIDFSEVSGGEEFAQSGNLGILDVLQSLKWLKNNIAAFGGDPENITLFGQSSGSALISLLMTMPEAQGLFQRAILQSGSVSMSMARKSTAEDATQLAEKLLALTGKTDMAGLMALSSRDLQNAADKLDGVLNFPERDGVVLTSGDIYTAFAENAGSYDVLIGSNADEVRYFLGAIGSLDVYGTYVKSAYDQLVAAMSAIPEQGGALVGAAESFIDLQLQGDIAPVWAYTEFLNDLLFRVPAIQMASSRSGTGKTYMYYYNIPVHSAVSEYIGADIGACHASEIPYILNIPGLLVPSLVLNSEQGQGLRTLVQNMWVDFAVDGEITGLTQYDAANRTTIIMSADAEVVSTQNDPLPEQRLLMENLLALNFSGRDIINLVSAGGTSEESGSEGSGSEGSGSGGSGSQESGSQESGSEESGSEESGSEESGSEIASKDIGVGTSGSGCNAGMSSLIFMLPLASVITITRKKR